MYTDCHLLGSTHQSLLNNVFLSDSAHSKYIKYNSICLEHYGRVIIIVRNTLVLSLILEIVKKGMKNIEIF